MSVAASIAGMIPGGRAARLGFNAVLFGAVFAASIALINGYSPGGPSLIDIRALADTQPAAGGGVEGASTDVIYEVADGERPPAGQAPAEPEAESMAVQAVLSAKRRAVLSSAIDARIRKFNVSNGDVFKKGDVLVEHDCSVDYARLKELKARQRTSQAQLDAYQKLRTLESASDIELMIARETNEQNIALVDQINGRLALCNIRAPFDGRVTNKVASQYEFAQTGRVLLDISSSEPLRAEFLVPSKWLRWLNKGAGLQIYINETDKSYAATITAIHGEVDPVSQSIQIVAEMEEYHEELLPGMSGKALFDPQSVTKGLQKGFLGLKLGGDRKAEADGAQ